MKTRIDITRTEETTAAIDIAIPETMTVNQVENLGKAVQDALRSAITDDVLTLTDISGEDEDEPTEGISQLIHDDARDILVAQLFRLDEIAADVAKETDNRQTSISVDAQVRIANAMCEIVGALKC